jgi:hypothetical protein
MNNAQGSLSDSVRANGPLQTHEAVKERHFKLKRARAQAVQPSLFAPAEASLSVTVADSLL